MNMGGQRATHCTHATDATIVDYFSQSTQSTHWIFDDEETLLSCRVQAIAGTAQHHAVDDASCRSSNSSSDLHHGLPHKGARKFASGYQRRKNQHKQQQQQYQQHVAEVQQQSRTSLSSTEALSASLLALQSSISPSDQETIVHFHAHQLQQLVGPNAMFEQLKRSSQVLSTAIMLLRRFYLSNSVVDFHPRHIAAASALLAVKTDCEPNLPIDLLSHATLAVHMKSQHNPLCRHELCPVSVEEIEEAERALLEGCDFRLRCHHPYKAIQMLSSDVVQYMMGNDYHDSMSSSVDGNSNNRCFTPSSPEGPTTDKKNLGSSSSSPPLRPHPISPCASPRFGLNEASPFSTPSSSSSRISMNSQMMLIRQHPKSWDTLCERALSIAQAALVYSDAPFLSTPNHLAVAAVSLALDGSTDRANGNLLGKRMESYLNMRFETEASSSGSELVDLKAAVNKILVHLDACPSLDLTKYTGGKSDRRRDHNHEQDQAAKVRQSFAAVARLRTKNVSAFTPLEQKHRRHHSRSRHSHQIRHHRHRRHSSSHYHHGYEYHSTSYHHQRQNQPDSHSYSAYNCHYSSSRDHIAYQHNINQHYERQRCPIPPPRPYNPSGVRASAYRYKTLDPATSCRQHHSEQPQLSQQLYYRHPSNVSISYDAPGSRTTSSMSGLKRIRDDEKDLDLIDADDLSSLFDFDCLPTDASMEPIQLDQHHAEHNDHNNDHIGVRRAKIARVTPITVPMV